jgi:spore germination protein YaaH
VDSLDDGSVPPLPIIVTIAGAPRIDTTAGKARVTDSTRIGVPSGCSAGIDLWIGLDSVSLRPLFLAPPISRPRRFVRVPCGSSITTAETSLETLARRISVVTSFQGGRFHPEVVRAVGESPDVLAQTAGFISLLATGNGARGVLLDFQEMAADDLPTLIEVARAISDSIRRRSPDPIGVIIPASDSSGYPARTLARVADLLLVRLFPEHGTGTPAGPIVSLPWFARRLGARAAEVGVNRIVAGITADGTLWDNRAGARHISYKEALRLAEAAGVPIVRDPASGNLHASSARDGWQLWVADHVLIERLIAEARRAGVTRFALFGLEGADSQLWQSLPQLLKR